MAKPALGRGLGALLGGAPTAAKPPASAPAPTAPSSTPVPLAAPIDPKERIQNVPLTRVQPCAFQPRKDFAPEALQELADSIREQGIVQPLIVRDLGKHLELIAGERRWRAAQLAGLTHVPVILREADDRAVLELALIENLQRENLNAIEEALGYSQLVSQFQLTQEQVAQKVGKSRAVVANALRLLKLPQVLQSYIREGRLSVGHAKVILALPESQQQQVAAERVIKEGLNVRQTEGLISKLQSNATEKRRNAPGVADANIANLENKLRERLGTKVHLRYSQGKGSLEIAFFSDDELERILQIVGVSAD
jgi:ParB family transcriptional regulator, chromosome partitioning protein